MVVTKVTSTGTFKKRQRLNSPSKLDEFLLDLTTEEEEREGKDVLSLFSSSRSNSLFKSYFRSEDKDSFPSSSSSSDHQAEVSGIDRLLNENEQRDVGDHQSEETQIGVSGAQGWLGKHRSQSVSLRFTPEWIEVQADDLDEYLCVQWRLEEIHLLEFYYKCEDAYLKDEESAIIAFKFHKSKDFLHGQCSENVCFDANDSYVLEISRWEWVSQEQHILALSARYGDILQQLTSEKRVMGYKEKLLQSIPQEVTDSVRFTQSIQAFEVLTFPQNDPDAVTITQKDIQRLKPKEFLNDTIIDFYIKFLQSKLTAKDKERFYFFNSFFFSKLADDDMMHGKAAFARVKKWTRKVKLFDKDYLFIPVNQSLHWSLIIICHPGNIGGLSKTSGFCMGMPCILHLDSMKGSHLDAGEIIRNYLLEEWFERSHQTNLSMEQTEELFSQLQCIYAQVPQQDNLWDCGLFLLHYVELFLKAAPVEFSLSRSQGFPYFLTESWFKPSEASGKRADIKRLILGLGGDSPSVEKAGSETSNYSQSSPLTMGMEIVALSNCQPCPSDPLSEKSPAEVSSDIKEGIKVCGATLTPEVCHFPEECEYLDNLEVIQNHSSVTEDLSSEIATHQSILGSNVILLMEEDDCTQQGVSWDVLDCPVLSPVRPLQVPEVFNDPVSMEKDASDLSAYLSLMPTSIFSACKASDESMHCCSVEEKKTCQRQQKTLIGLTRLGEDLFHNLSSETTLSDMSSNFELENRPANSRGRKCIVEKPLEMFGGQRVEELGVSASIHDIEELSSDDSLDEWERSRARRSPKFAPQIGKRMTRSKTQKPSPNVKEEARQAALSLCKEKAKKRLK
ncbi:hypothetical protein CY35_07G083200 [Sphagnum magellanicum]|uniref:Uncharacterized protein n=1 Tax=Sphagnum magellanicum TaxID=128215 RepID=A0ACB8HMD0_9BRYO|nr:hypothetical protein CY35_07G083200 [Sphagnum magellanicum]